MRDQSDFQWSSGSAWDGLTGMMVWSRALHIEYYSSTLLERNSRLDEQLDKDFNDLCKYCSYTFDREGMKHTARLHGQRS